MYIDFFARGGDKVQVIFLQVTLHFPWATSLKEKRNALKSILSKTQNKFNVSVAEIEHQNLLQISGIGIAYIAANAAQVDGISNSLLEFIQNNIDGEITQSHLEER